MRKALAIFSLLSTGSALAATTPQPGPVDVVRAMAERGQTGVRVTDVRVRGCKGFDDEPTEFTCSLSQRSGKIWRRFTMTFALDGKGWHIVG